MTLTAALFSLAMPLVLPQTWLQDWPLEIGLYQSGPANPFCPGHLNIQTLPESQSIAPTEIRFMGPSTIMSSHDFARSTAATLMSYLTLSPNWDGEGAEAPAQESVWNALGMLEVASLEVEAPKAMVMASGEVALYWDLGDVYAEIGFDADGRYYAYATRPGFDPVHLDDIPVYDELGSIRIPPQVLDILTRVSPPIAA
jgi:hypothetical protein